VANHRTRSYFTRSSRLQEETRRLATALWLLGVVSYADAAVARLGHGTGARGAAVHRLRGLPAGAPGRPDLLRARGVPRPRPDPRRAAARRLRRGCSALMVIEPFGRARRCLHCTGPLTRTAGNPPLPLACTALMDHWPTLPGFYPTGAPRRAKSATGAGARGSRHALPARRAAPSCCT
jgi:hypothetical protein